MLNKYIYIYTQCRYLFKAKPKKHTMAMLRINNVVVSSIRDHLQERSLSQKAPEWFHGMVCRACHVNYHLPFQKAGFP